MWYSMCDLKLPLAYAALLAQLVAIQRDHGDYTTAIPYAGRWLALDPLHEPMHRHLMQLYA